MTIANGSHIIEDDLNALTTTARGFIRTDNAQLPLLWEHNAFFHGVLAATPPRLLRQIVSVPCDCWLETIAVTTAGFTAASIVTATLTAPSILDAFPVVGVGTAGSARATFTRPIYDGTKGRATPAAMKLNRAVRVLYAGTRCTLALDVTSNVAAGAFVQVTLCFRSFFGR